MSLFWAHSHIQKIHIVLHKKSFETKKKRELLKNVSRDLLYCTISAESTFIRKIFHFLKLNSHQNIEQCARI